MMLGVVTGLLGALCQAIYYFVAAYVGSRYTLSTRAMLVFSHLLMGGVSLLGVALMLPGSGARLEAVWVPLLAMNVCYLGGQAALFRALRRDVASRVSPLLGLKVVLLAGVTALAAEETLSVLQWTAVILCGGAALAMSLAGGRLKPSAAGWILVAVAGYSGCDLGVVALTRGIEVPGLHGALLSVFLAYSVAGLLVAPVGIGLSKRQWRKAFKTWPVASAWLVSMLLMFIAFNILGAVHGNIIQSSRGILSIALALLATRLGVGLADPLKRGRVFYQRLACAVVMAGAIVLFQLG